MANDEGSPTLRANILKDINNARSATLEQSSEPAAQQGFRGITIPDSLIRLNPPIHPERQISTFGPRMTEQAPREPRIKLEQIRWRLMDEPPSDVPPNPLLSEKVAPNLEQTAADKRSLKEQADEAMNSSSGYLRSLMGNISQRGYTFPLSGDRNDEVNMLILLLDAHGIANSGSYTTETRNFPKIFDTIIPILRDSTITNGARRAAWTGLNNAPRSSAGETMLKELPQTIPRMTSTELEACIVASLACGDPMSALQLVQSADTLILDNGMGDPSHALGRVRGVFEKAYELYPPTVKARFDSVAGTIGIGRLSGLAKAETAQQLKVRSKERQKARFKDSRDIWYGNQTIANPEVRMTGIEEPSLQTTIEAVAAAGGRWQQVEEKVQQQATSVVEARVANLISSELARRVHPELELTVLLGDMSTEIGQSKTTHRVHNPAVATVDSVAHRRRYSGAVMDEYNQVFPELFSQDLSANERKDRISGPTMTPPNASEAANQLLKNDFRPDFIGLKDLFSLLKSPDGYMNWLKYHGLNEFNKKYQDDPNQRDEGRNRQAIIAQKLVAGVSFLQAISEEPAVAKVLAEQFGLGQAGTKEHLERVQELLRSNFSQNVDSQEVGTGQDAREGTDLTLYDAILNEHQYEEDRRTAGMIVKGIEPELSTLVEASASKAKQALDGAIINRRAEAAGLQSGLDQIHQVEAGLTTAEAEYAQLATARVSLEVTPAINTFQKLFNNKGVTAQEKSSKLKILEVRMEGVKRRIRDLKTQQIALPNVEESQVQQLEKLVGQLSQMVPEDMTIQSSSR